MLGSRDFKEILRKRLPIFMSGANQVLSQTFRGGRPLYYCWMRIQWGGTMIEFKGSHFEREVILWGVRWYTPFTRRPENPWAI
jgi:hypothetical protein